MSKDEIETREKIMTAAIALIEQYGDTAKITVRDIAAKAGVNLGLINYHFQTKENLINQCVQRIINVVISKFEPLYKSLEMKPLDKLRHLVKSTAAFLAVKPGISRISIVNDLISGNPGDNSSQTGRAYFPVIKEVCWEGKTDREVAVLLHILISTIQIAFLRKDVIRETMAMDFFDTQQRDAFVDLIIDILFVNTGEVHYG